MDAGKVCGKCKENKSVSLFSKSAKAKDGLQCWCKDCARKYRIKNGFKLSLHAFSYRSTRRETIRARDRARYIADPSVCVRSLARQKTEESRMKHRAHNAVSRALKAGILVRPDHCSKCDRSVIFGEIIGHHEDYTRKLDVIWLCESCHRFRHAAIDAIAKGGSNEGIAAEVRVKPTQYTGEAGSEHRLLPDQVFACRVS